LLYLKKYKILELKYVLTFGYHPSQFDWMLYRIKEFLELPNLKEEWQKKRETSSR